MTKTHFCPQCGDPVGDGRHALGYKLCLPCGDQRARQVKHCTIHVSNPDDLKQLNPKRIGE